MSPQLMTTLMTIGGLGFVALRQLRQRRVALARLWAMPIIIVAYAIMNIDFSILTQGAHWMQLIVAATIGGAAGVVMGGLINRVQRDDTTGELIVPGSVLALVAWFGLAAVKFGAERLLGGASADAGLATALLLVTLSASVISRRLCWYVKYQALGALSAGV